MARLVPGVLDTARLVLGVLGVLGMARLMRTCADCMSMREGRAAYPPFGTKESKLTGYELRMLVQSAHVRISRAIPSTPTEPYPRTSHTQASAEPYPRTN
jgi:hypothetical protein